MKLYTAFSQWLWRIILIIVLIFIPNSDISAQSPQDEIIRFERAAISISTGLYGGFLRDRDGFLWIGTMGEGVYRYDGHELKNYPQGPDTLSGAMVSAIVQDQDGVLWFATWSEGITQYDKSTGIFTHHQHHPDNANSLSSNNLPDTTQTLFVDRANTLWVGTKNGLNNFDKTTGTWTHYTYDPDDVNSVSDNTITAILQDRDGPLWVGTKEGGLNSFDQHTGTWTRYTRNLADANSLNDNWVNTLLQDHDGILWIGTKEGGLNRFDKTTETFTHYLHDPENPASLGHNDIRALYQDSSGRLWICHTASDNGGLEMLDTQTGIFTRYTHDPENPSSLSSNNVRGGIYEDPETGVLWVFHATGEIDKYDPQAIKFTLWQHNPDNPNSLSHNSVLPMLEDNQGIIWIGTGVGGLNKYDRQTGTFTHYLHDPDDPYSLPHTYVSGLYEDSSGVFWVGSMGGTLSIFDRDTGKCVKHYRHDPENPNSITKSDRLKYIIDDRDDPNILWLGTVDGGLDRFDKKQEIFTHYVHDPANANSLSYDKIPILYDDGKGTLWIATYGGGLDRFEKQTGTFTHYQHDPDDPQSISSNTLYEVYQDTSGTLWVTGKGGLSKFDRHTETFAHYTKAHGFPSNILTSLLEDDAGNLWLGTIDAGLIQFDPDTETVKVYTPSDGLQGETFFWISRLKTRDGELWFGGANGANSFYPQDITDNAYIPPIVLTAFKQGGEDVVLGMAPEKLDEIKLDWQHNFFEFQFAALNYTLPEKNQYAYMLEGRDTDWYYAGTNPSGRYTGLRGGTYTLRLKGSNNDGVWNEQGISLRIIVTPPFWQTWWFYTLAAVSVLGGLWAIYQVKTNQLKTERAAALALQESEERYRLVAENVTDVIWTMDMGLKFTYFSPSVARLRGYSVQEAIAQTIEESMTPASLEVAIQVFAEELDMHNEGQRDSTRSRTIELELTCKDGSTVWTELKTNFAYGDADQPIGVIGVTRDITERKRAEEDRKRLLVHVQEQARRMQQIMDTVPEGVLLLDARRQVVLANPIAQKDLAVLAEVKVGDTLAHLGDLAVEELLSSGLKGSWLDVEMDDRSFQIIAQSLKVKGPADGWVIVIRDMTRIREFERRAQQQDKLAAVGQLAAGIAHDFNNIMATIVLYAQVTAREKGVSDIVRERMTTINQQAMHATNLIQQILALAVTRCSNACRSTCCRS
ncbi:MAG: PAS domain S-box protein [Chloroflexi bacterium]|nr:PAS domain S-box protein [Chloroflexota bacterium]